MMSFKKDNVLKFNQYMKSDKMLYIIYADSQTLLKKTDGCANNLEKSSSTKSGKHILCRFLMPTVRALIIQKIDIVYIVGKIVWKSFIVP